MVEPAADFAGEPDGFGRLWTPHRMVYIKGENKPAHDDAGDDCPFCSAPKRSDEDALIVARGEHVYAVLNLYPYNSGHLMTVPYRHVADYTELDVAETAEFGAFTQRAMTVIRDGDGAARVQHRHEPGRRWPVPASPRTCTSTSCRAGAATRTSCRWSRTPGCCRSCSRMHARCSPRRGRAT